MSIDNETQVYIDKCLANMDESQKGLTRPMLESFVWFKEQTAKLQADIEREGEILEVEKGGPNNRHMEMVVNPKVSVVTKYSTQASGFYAKLMRFMSKAEADQVDELENFLRNKAR